MATVSQTFALIISAIFLVSSIYLFIYGRKQGRLFYLSMCIHWLMGVIYYSFIQFSNEFIGHDFSSILRVSQYLLIGGWFFLEALDRFISRMRGYR